MCGIAGVVDAAAPGGAGDRARRAGGHGRCAAPPRPRRVRRSIAIDRRRTRARAAVDHRSGDRASSRSPTSARRCGSSSTARSSTTSSCATSWSRAATASARAATPKSSSTPTRSGARRPSSASTASGRSRCGTASNAQLVLARDPFGVRPLYVCEHGGRLYFASEVKAIFAGDSDAAPPARPASASTRRSRSGAPVPPQTVFAASRSWSPGPSESTTAGGVRRHRAYQPAFPGRRAPRRSRARSTTPWTPCGRRSSDATSLRMLRADVPVGSYLSGGLDSSLIAALGLRAKGAKLPHLLAALRRRRVRRDVLPAADGRASRQRPPRGAGVARRHRARLPRGHPPHRAADPAHGAGAALSCCRNWCATPASRSC